MAFNSVEKYCPADVDMMKAALGLPSDVTAKDSWMEILIESAKQAADEYLQRDYGKKIPGHITQWVIQDAIRVYENPDQSVTGKQVVGIGSEQKTVDENTRFAGLALKSLKSPIGGSQVY